MPGYGGRTKAGGGAAAPKATKTIADSPARVSSGALRSGLDASRAELRSIQEQMVRSRGAGNDARVRGELLRRAQRVRVDIRAREALLGNSEW